MLVRIARILAVPREPTTRTVSPGLSFFTLSCHPQFVYPFKPGHRQPRVRAPHPVQIHEAIVIHPPDSRFACYSKQKSSCPFSGYTSLLFCLRFRVNT
jgi:hypothetical protein